MTEISTARRAHHYLYGERRPLSVDGPFADYFAERTAVISIDMHEGHLSTAADCPCPAPRGREIIAPINDFHRSVRDLNIPVIHVLSALRVSGADDLGGRAPSAWRVTFPMYVGEISGAAQHALQGSRWTTPATEVDPRDELVTGKKRLSAFYPTDLDFLLRQMGVSTIILDGIMTDCCVLNTAFDGSNRGYRVIVAGDLCRGTDQHLEEAALAMMSLHMALVVDSADLLAVLGETLAPAQQPGPTARRGYPRV
ncbi:MAG: isochorismatase family cysteine hydrolase [Gordonia sp. (in: high G+C Gram-positive bacteria)]